MALDPKIASLKAAGTYRFEFDKSQVVSIPANQTRLIVGFSRTGPFNTPVFIPDTAFFKQVYGDIDRTLERKDSFFHRSCLTALERGPILALNLLTLTSTDLVYANRFATSATPDAQRNLGYAASTDGYEFSKFYNTDKFWYPDTNSFLIAMGANTSVLNSASVNDFFDIVNLGQNPISVIAKKSAPGNVLPYQVTVEEWYGSANVPGFLDKDSLISDFFVDVFVIDGNFGGKFEDIEPYKRFESDPTFQQYFNATEGLQRRVLDADATDTKIAQFFNEPEVNLVATYTACLIPDFVDLLGNNLFVEKVINADTASTGLFCTVNEDLFSGDILIDGVSGGIDLVGHNLEYAQTTSSQTDINMLSYSGTIVSDLAYGRQVEAGTVAAVTTSTMTTSVISGGTDVQIVATNANAAKDAIFTAMKAMTANTATTVGSFIQGTVGTTVFWVPVTLVTPAAAGGNITSIQVSAVGGITPAIMLKASYTFVNESAIDFIADEFPLSNATAGIIGGYGSTALAAFALGTLTDGDEAVYNVGGIQQTSFLRFVSTTYGFIPNAAPTGTPAGTPYAISDSAYFPSAVRIIPYQDADFTVLQDHANFTLDGTGLFLTSKAVAVAANTLNVQTLKGSNNLTIAILGDNASEAGILPNQVVIDSTNPQIAKVIVGNYLVHSEGSSTAPSRLTRINSVRTATPAEFPLSIPANGSGVLVTTQSEIDTNKPVGQATTFVELYRPIDRWIDFLNIFELPGYAYPLTKLPNGTNSRQNEILSPILLGTQLANALTDRETINFRYLVDTFGNGIEANCKSIFTKLCGARKNAFAIVNAPSAKDFRTNIDPTFTTITGQLSSKFIAEGGDLSKNPTIRYSLPSATSDGSYGGYYYPFVTVRDLGKNINVPPAANVSNNFILKYENALPWSIVAGVRRGVIGGNGVVGLEINLDTEDRYYLEPFGINPIVFQSGTGPTIFANKTAQQVPKSALSSINVREVVIYIQDGIEAILKNYLFEFNTAQTRLEIKTLADNFLSTVQNDDGVYDYRNIMDETNNTPEVIDQNVGILDTYIEPVRGMEILVQRTTILRTGAISSGNFQ